MILVLDFGKSAISIESERTDALIRPFLVEAANKEYVRVLQLLLAERSCARG